jgi:hypothetical protein
MTTAHGDASFLLIELGLVLVGLAILGRLGSRWVFFNHALGCLCGCRRACAGATYEMN